MEDKVYKCLVVDDEPIARKIIIKYIEQVPFLAVAAESIHALNAIEYYKKHPGNIDIIFLDINMPNLSGVQLLKILKPAQPVIFTTAYAEYAVESYDLDAVDYLLKPFSFERFTKAVYKAIDQISATDKNPVTVAREKRNVIFIKSDGKNYPVYADDILYCEAMKNYTRVVLKTEQKLMPLIPLSKLETLLSEASDDFVRVHRSFIIAKKYITAVSRDDVSMGKFEIPMGMNFKESFLKSIGMKEA